jgi:hypothetical protein
MINPCTAHAPRLDDSTGGVAAPGAEWPRSLKSEPSPPPQPQEALGNHQ